MRRKLIKCRSCEADIAINAETCPKCGSPNEWLHPRISEFLAAGDQIETKERFNVEYRGAKLAGETEERRSWDFYMKAGFGAIAVFLLSGFITPLAPYGELALAAGIIALAWGTLLIVFGSHKGKAKYFEIDLSEEPPKWESNDDAFWTPVRQFFGVK